MASKAVGSISTSWAPASSGIGGTFSVNIGSFASLNAGAGISGTSAFASANVSILGLPISGIGKSAGVFGKTANPFASTLVGNFTDSVLTNTMSSNGYGQFSLPNNFAGGGSSNYSLISGKATGSTTVGSFASSVTRDTAYGFAMGQLAQTGIPTAFGAVSQGIQTYQGVSGAFRDVFAPPTTSSTPTVQSTYSTDRAAEMVERELASLQSNHYSQLSQSEQIRLEELLELSVVSASDANGGAWDPNVRAANQIQKNLRPSSLHTIIDNSLLAGAMEYGQSLQRLGSGLIQPFANIADAGGMIYESGSHLVGRKIRYGSLGQTGHAVENGATFGEIAYETGSGLAQGAVDVGTVGIYPTYQYANGQLTDQEYGDRLVGAGLAVLGSRSRIASTRVGSTSVVKLPAFALQEVQSFGRNSAGFVSRSEVGTYGISANPIPKITLKPKIDSPTSTGLSLAQKSRVRALLDDGFPARSAIRHVQGKDIRAFDVLPYKVGRFSTDLPGHEVLNNRFLEMRGLSPGRGMGVNSTRNPAIALPRDLQSSTIQKLQRKHGVWFARDLKDLTRSQVIRKNLDALREAGLGEATVQEIRRAAIVHARRLGRGD